ncbi:Replication initiator protein (plasmid) [Pseudomonas antarctica]|uniref:Replication initiator protein n=1 Tax=Pseudomonas antarctica TaxID=219572 RepID=A0A172Z9P0_9PSED|nr:replication initiation protein [Pseudomonas antarctica]ANF89243.1 Replication initiator protein [Pseudomonas antarctica]
MSNLPKPSKAEPKPLRVTKSNTLITASYRLTLNEQRLILAAISKLDPRRPMPKKVSVSAADYSDIYGVQLRHAYEQMKVAADELYERDIKTFDGAGMERKRWVDRAKYLDGEGRVELSFTIHVIPYLTMLYSKVTSYDLRRVACLDSSHSFRLFEMLMQFRKTGWAYIEVEALRVALGLSEAYQRFNNLRQRVIDPAVEELRTKSNLDVSYELRREGRKVIAIKFTFCDLAQLPLNLELDPEDLPPLPEFDPAEESEWLLTQPLGELAEAQEPGLLFAVTGGDHDQPE